MKLNPSIKNMSNEYIFFTDQTALTFRICLVHADDTGKCTCELTCSTPCLACNKLLLTNPYMECMETQKLNSVSFLWCWRFANPQYARTGGETHLVLFTVLYDGTIRCFITCRSFEESGNVKLEGEINMHFFPTNSEGTLRHFLNSDVSWQQLHSKLCVMFV